MNLSLDQGFLPLDYAEVTGIVRTVNYKAKSFEIELAKMKTKVTAVTDFDCPIRYGDNIYAHCLVKNNVFHLTRMPVVHFPVDKFSILQGISYSQKLSFKENTQEIYKLYNLILRIVEEHQIVPFLSGLAQAWVNDHNPDILYMFGDKTTDEIEKLLNWWHYNYNLRKLKLLNLTDDEIKKAKMSCEEIYQKCITNPYLIPAIPAEKCLQILEQHKKTATETDKICGSIVRVIYNYVVNRGFTGIQLKTLIRVFPNLPEYMDELKADYQVKFDLDTAYLAPQFNVETWVNNYIINLRKSDPITYEMPVDEYLEIGDQVVYRRPGVFESWLSPDQKIAIQGALDHKISIITGLGGCGKTRCLEQLIKNLEIRQINYAVCSFTGKAVARIREVTLRPNPSTMHRLISNVKTNKLKRDQSQFAKDIPQEQYEHLIIDECSMVTIELFYELVKLYPSIKKVTLVGDVNQLEPIGWGCLFKQLISSKTIPVYYLTTNFRIMTNLGDRDGIILNASMITDYDPNYPFEFIETSNFHVVKGGIEQVYEAIRGCKLAGVNPKDVVILSPYNEDLEILNKTFQEIYDLGARSVTANRVRWMISDRVMLLENDKDIGVFNGETGDITNVSPNYVEVDFGISGKHQFSTTVPEKVYNKFENDYSKKERSVANLVHAYACSIDKSQGSEWKFVIIYVARFNKSAFLCRNRFYTAMSRARLAEYIISPNLELLKEVVVQKSGYRHENLTKRLNKELDYLPAYLWSAKKANNKSDSIENMADDYFGGDFDFDF